jgi:hypothetical protein
MAILVERMLAQACSLRTAARVTPGTNANETRRMYPAPATPTADILAGESDLNLLFGKQDLRLGDMYSHLDPFGHYLSCSYAMIDMSVKVLASIESNLGIPRHQSVIVEAMTMNTNCSPYWSGLTTSGSASPAQQSRQRGPSLDGTPQSLSSLTVAMIWDEETSIFGHGNTTLARFQRSRAELSRLVKSYRAEAVNFL